MITEYIDAAMHKANFTCLKDGKEYHGEIPGINGLTAKGTSLEQCRKELKKALEDWIFYSLVRNTDSGFE